MIPESFKKKRDEAADKWANPASLKTVPLTVKVMMERQAETFSIGADFGYLEGREAMAREIVKWLRSPKNKEYLHACLSAATEIERQFLKKENNNE